MPAPRAFVKGHSVVVESLLQHAGCGAETHLWLSLSMLREARGTDFVSCGARSSV